MGDAVVGLSARADADKDEACGSRLGGCVGLMLVAHLSDCRSLVLVVLVSGHLWSLGLTLGDWPSLDLDVGGRWGLRMMVARVSDHGLWLGLITRANADEDEG